MAKVANAVFVELREVIRDVWGLDTTNPQWFDVGAARIPWRKHIQDLEDGGGTGLSLPYVILGVGKVVETEGPSAAAEYQIPIAVYLIDSVRGLETTVTTGASSAIQTVGSTTGMFAGLKLYFETADEYRTVVSVDSGTQITLDSSISTTTGEDVESYDATAEIYNELETLREELISRNDAESLTSFGVLEKPEIDASLGIEPNQAALQFGYPLQAGEISFTAHAS